MGHESQTKFDHYLVDFQELSRLRERLLHVLQAIPEDVQRDFLSDDRFSIAVDNYERGKGSTVFMAAPGGHGQQSRSVVLKPLLNDCSNEFAYYVIAHEFAHAFLRNGPWGEITDVEDAADGLAAHWGFRRPNDTPWTNRSI